MERSKEVFWYTKKSNKSNAFIQFSDAAWIPTLLAIFLISGSLFPYITILIRGTLNPFLPFISQAGGSPPESGILCICAALAALVGFFGLQIIHLGTCIYQERVPKEKQRFLKFLNGVSMAPGYLTLLGMIIVGAYPVDFHRQNEDWLLVTMYPHLTGAFFLFGGGVLCTSIFTMITAIAFPEKKRLLGIRVCLVVVTIVTSLICCSTLQQVVQTEYYNEDRMKQCYMKPIQYDTNYLICSTCEWIMVAAFVIFTLTTRREGKLMSVKLSVDLLDNISDSQAPKCCNKLKASSQSSENLLEKSDNEVNGKK